MAIFSIDVQIWATAYIRADTAEEALEIAKGLKGESLGLQTGEVGDGIEIDGGDFGPDLPDVTLSPAMTMEGPDQAATAADLDCVHDDEGGEA